MPQRKTTQEGEAGSDTRSAEEFGMKVKVKSKVARHQNKYKDEITRDKERV